MPTQVHICANRSWGGAESRALACALAAPEGRAVVVCCDRKPLLDRISRAGVTAMPARFTGLFAGINLSRVLRHLPQGPCHIFIHSPEATSAIASALPLTGRNDLKLSAEAPQPELPPHPVDPPAKGEAPLMMWLGRITADCGLPALIEALGRLTDKPWRLRIVGEGESRTVMPMVHRTRALGINDRIEWTGYTDCVYTPMNGVGLGIITRPDVDKHMAAKEFAAAGIPVVAATDPDTLHRLIDQHI